MTLNDVLAKQNVITKIELATDFVVYMKEIVITFKTNFIG